MTATALKPAAFARAAAMAAPPLRLSRPVAGAIAAASTSLASSSTSEVFRKRRYFSGSSVATGQHSSFWDPSGDIDVGLDVARSVRSDFRPKRIILLRHGESRGNVDETAYVTTPDWRVPLTDLGRKQAVLAGERLRDEIIGPDETVAFYHSPYVRTKQTLEELQNRLKEEQILGVKEEPRISEQQFGNFQNVQEVLDSKRERHKFGRFYYRFPSGEAGLDVYSRVSSFITTLVRDCHTYSHLGYDLDRMNVVIVTHGLTLRLFLMRWFQWTVEEFEESENPDNARLITMRKRMMGPGHKHRYYELDSDDLRSIALPKRCGVPRNIRLHPLGDQKGDEDGEGGGAAKIQSLKSRNDLLD